MQTKNFVYYLFEELFFRVFDEDHNDGRRSRRRFFTFLFLLLSVCLWANFFNSRKLKIYKQTNKKEHH